MMIISNLILALAGFIFAEAEILHGYIWNKKVPFKPFLTKKGLWYNTNHYEYHNPILNFLFRYPLAFLKDGFHFLKSLAICLFIISLVNYDNLILTLIINYVVFSLGFNLRFLIRK